MIRAIEEFTPSPRACRTNRRQSPKSYTEVIGARRPQRPLLSATEPTFLPAACECRRRCAPDAM